MIRLESRHDLSFPRAIVWPVLSQTDWLNRSAGLPPVAYQIAPRPEGGSIVTARARIFGRELRWRELPFEWLEPEFYRVRRIFELGPFREASLGMDLLEQPGGRTRVVVYSEWMPRHAAAKWLARRWLGPRAERDMRRIMAHVEEFLHRRVKVALPRLPVQPVNETALQTGLQRLRDARQPADLVQRLEGFLRESPDVAMSRIRPLTVARQWDRDPWEVLALFLHGPRSGLLDLRWEILCPNCRSSRQTPAASLNGLKRTSHCEVCQIEFDAEFDQSVELTFGVNAAVRRHEEQTFCLAGPGGKPHVVSQLWLEPNEERVWKMPPLTSALRLRSPEVQATLTFGPEMAVAPGSHLVIVCDPARFVARREAGGADGSARVQNPNRFPVLLALERLAWSEDVLTASRVTNWQQFRDLFAHEVISPTEQVTVGSQVVLFTDLRGSTAMYHNLGDAPAYALVRDHFAVVTEAVRAHHGAVIKTIGDAVMATFSRVDEALRAVRQMHRQLRANPSPANPLALKSSLHIGPCLAVNANDKLDFFGTTINLAARMVGCCRGGDLTVSDDLFLLPEMTEFLKTCPGPPEPAEVRFRGFEIPNRVWRIEMTQSAQDATRNP